MNKEEKKLEVQKYLPYIPHSADSWRYGVPIAGRHRPRVAPTVLIVSYPTLNWI